MQGLTKLSLPIWYLTTYFELLLMEKDLIFSEIHDNIK
jgi:hypothetical protein